MNKILLTLITVTYLTNTYANTEKDSVYKFNKFSYFDFAFGSSYLMKDDVSEDFNFGFGGSFQMRFDTKSRKFSIIPGFKFRIFSYPLEDEPDVHDKLSLISLGLQVDYKIFKSSNDKFAILAFLEFNHTWIDNRFRWKVENNSSYGYNSQNSSSFEHFKLFNGKALSVLAGTKLRYKIFYLDLGYDFMKTKVMLSNELKRQLDGENLLYDPEPKFNFNSLNISIGFSAPFGPFRFTRTHYYGPRF